MERRRREDAPLSAPNTEGNVWPKQVCPAFEPRANTPEGMRQCWYCRCADFHLDKPRSLDVGVCYWPKKITMIMSNSVSVSLATKFEMVQNLNLGRN